MNAYPLQKRLSNHVTKEICKADWLTILSFLHYTIHVPVDTLWCQKPE